MPFLVWDIVVRVLGALVFLGALAFAVARPAAALRAPQQDQGRAVLLASASHEAWSAPSFYSTADSANNAERWFDHCKQEEAVARLKICDSFHGISNWAAATELRNK
jgi:hypothetical protein